MVYAYHWVGWESVLLLLSLLDNCLVVGGRPSRTRHLLYKFIIINCYTVGQMRTHIPPTRIDGMTIRFWSLRFLNVFLWCFLLCIFRSLIKTCRRLIVPWTIDSWLMCPTLTKEPKTFTWLHHFQSEKTIMDTSSEMDYHVSAEVFDAMTMHPRMNRPRTFFPWLGLVRSPGQSKKFSFSEAEFLCPLQSRLQNIYHGQPNGRVDFIPLSSTMDLASVLVPRRLFIPALQ
jgi:hypothetical protein